MENYETFYDEVKDVNGTLRVTIPLRMREYTGIKAGDKVKVLIKKEV